AEGLLAPAEPGQPLRPAGPGKEPECHLGQADAIGALGGDPEVAAERDLKAAAEAMAIDRRDDDLWDRLELPHRLVRADDERALYVEIALREDVDVGARREEALVRAPHQDRLDGVVACGLLVWRCWV